MTRHDPRKPPTCIACRQVIENLTKRVVITLQLASGNEEATRIGSYHPKCWEKEQLLLANFRS